MTYFGICDKYFVVLCISYYCVGLVRQIIGLGVFLFLDDAWCLSLLFAMVVFCLGVLIGLLWRFCMFDLLHGI